MKAAKKNKKHQIEEPDDEDDVGGEQGDDENDAEVAVPEQLNGCLTHGIVVLSEILTATGAKLSGDGPQELLASPGVQLVPGCVGAPPLNTFMAPTVVDFENFNPPDWHTNFFKESTSEDKIFMSGLAKIHPTSSFMQHVGLFPLPNTCVHVRAISS
jgi:hypothetical protein